MTTKIDDQTIEALDFDYVPMCDVRKEHTIHLSNWCLGKNQADYLIDFKGHCRNKQSYICQHCLDIYNNPNFFFHCTECGVSPIKPVITKVVPL